MTASTGLTRLRPSGRVVREVLLTTGAVLGLLCIVASVAAIGFGVKPLVFRSGSMSPEITTGGMGLVHSVPASDLAQGDIVSVHDEAGTRVTHRIVDIERDGNTASLTLKGDANDVADAEPYVVDRADRVFFHVNGAGYVVTWLSSPTAVFAGGVIVGALLMFVFRPTGRRPGSREHEDHLQDRDERTAERQGAQAGVHASHRGPRFRGAAVGVVTLALIAGLTAIGSDRVTDTDAAFVDTGTSKSGSFSTYAFPAFGSNMDFRCFDPGLAIDTELHWTAQAGIDTYRITIAKAGKPTYTWDVPAAVAGTKQSFVIPEPNEPGILTISDRRTATIQAVKSSWTSAESRAISIDYTDTAISQYWTCARLGPRDAAEPSLRTLDM